MSDVSAEDIKRQLQQMDPYEFEKVVATLWESQGYETTVRRGSGDRGIDVEATKQTPVPQKVLIQAKRYAEDNKVGAEAVRTYATLYQQVPDADTVVIVTTSAFTLEGQRVGREQHVKTVDCDALVALVRETPESLDRLELNGGERARESTHLPTDDTAQVRERTRQKLRTELEWALQYDGLLASRGTVRVEWRNAKGKQYKIKVQFFTAGWIRKKGVTSKMDFRPKVKKDPVQEIRNVEHVVDLSNGIRLRTTRDGEGDVELELRIIQRIVQRTGADLADLTVHTHS